MKKRVLLAAFLLIGCSLPLAGCVLKQTDSGTISETQSTSSESSVSSSESISELQKEPITGIGLEDATFVYDGLPHSLSISGKLPEGVDVEYAGNGKIDAGEYEVTATLRDRTNRYIVPQPLTAMMKIVPAEISGISFEDVVVSYDGNPHSIFISGHLPEGVDVEYVGNGKTDAGKYEVTAKFSTGQNYEPLADMTAMMTIEKASLDMSGVSFPGATFTYDGNPHSLSIEGELPAGVSVTYVGNGMINAGDYHVTARFETDNNHKPIPDMSAELKILKAKVDNISFEDQTFEYDGTAHSISVSGEIPAGVSVSYEGNGKTNAGEYQVTAHFETNDNYEPIGDMTAKMVISKAKITDVGLEDKTFTYNGRSYSIMSTVDFPEGVSVSYEGNKQTEIGEHKVTAHFEVGENFEPIDDVTVTMRIIESRAFIYELNDDGKSYSIAGLSGLGGGGRDPLQNYIPATYRGLPVTSIKACAFNNAHSLVSLVIPESVTSIGSLAFDDCPSLSQISLPNSLKFVGERAFERCPSLKRTEYNGGLYLGNSENPYVYLEAVKDPSVTSFSVAEGNKSISEAAFRECQSLASLTLPSSLEYIGESAFDNCPSLEYSITGNGKYLGNQTNPFLYLAKIANGSLASCTISEQTKIIGANAFQYAAELKTIVIPDSVSSIDDNAFSSCTSLSSVTFGKNVRSIGRYAFDYCNALKTVTLPDSLLSLGDYSFNQCSALERVRIPKLVSSIGECAFAYCHSLTAIEVDSENGAYASVDGVLFNKEMTDLHVYPANKSGSEYSIPNTVKTIFDAAFANAESLVSVTMPDSVTKMNPHAFSGCKSLSSVTLSKSLKMLEISAFYECVSLEAIDIPDSVNELCSFSFHGCASLKSIHLSKNITTIGDDVFSGCASLKSFDVAEDNKNYASVDGILFDKAMTHLIAFPAAREGSEYAIPSTVSSIGTGAFDNANLESITISGGVAAIPMSCFQNCQSLEKITLAEGVAELGVFAFENCASLKTVILPASLTMVGYGAFFKCNSLETVYYGGTYGKWSAMTIEDNNSYLEAASIFFYSEKQPTSDGDYWHYVEGVPTPWEA